MTATQRALQNLRDSSFRLWFYLAKNKDEFELGLSQKACANWGLKKDSYYRAVQELKQKGYLILENEVWHFYEEPKEQVEISVLEMEPEKIEKRALNASDF